MKTADEQIGMKARAPARTPGRPPNPDLDRAILEAALQVLSDVGAEAFHISAVARRARTTTPAIYRRFAGKAELLFAALEMDMAAVEMAAEYQDQGSLRDDLLAWIETIFRAYSPERTRILASLNFQARVNRRPLDLLSKSIHRFGSGHWREIIRRAVERGELAHSDIPEMIGRVPGGIAMHLAMLRELPQDANDLKSQLVDAVMLPALLAACLKSGVTDSGATER